MKNKKKMVTNVVGSVMFIATVSAAAVLSACTKAADEYDIVAESAVIEIEKGDSAELVYTLTKNGVEDSSLTATVSVAEGTAVTYSAETNELYAVESGTATVKIVLDGHTDVEETVTVNVPAYTIDFTVQQISIEEGSTFAIPYTVKRDGVTVSDKKVDFSVEGDAITVNSLKKQITGVKEGTATLVAALADDSSVTARATVTVKGVFFSRDSSLKRGELDFSKEDEGIVEILGGQATVLCKQDDTKFVFKGTLSFEGGLDAYQSVGIGAFYDNGDNALWFATIGGSGTDGTYSVYIRNFLNGWSNPAYDSQIENYKNYNFGSSVEYVIVRDGDDYWYSIGGLCGTFKDTTGVMTGEPLFPGFFSQEKAVTISDFSVDYSQEAVDAAKLQYGVSVSKLTINEADVILLQKGMQYTYTASVYSAAAVTEPVVWTLDKSEMTAGAEQTTIENGTLSLANDAAGFVTVKATCGDKEATVRIEISEEELNKENDKIAVYGGVELDEATDKVTFTEKRSFNNATLDMSKYRELAYMAKLKQTVKGNFAIEFKVANFKSDTDNGVLLVSLGGEGNNFAISAGSVGAYTYGYDGGNEYKYGVSTAALSSYDPLAEHTWRIVVADGAYTVYVDGTQVSFNKNPVRRLEDFVADCNVMFTTGYGASCEVYGITITEDTADTTFYKVNGNQTVADGTATLNFVNNAWGGRDKNVTTLYYVPALGENFCLSMDVSFSAAQADGKFVIALGNYEFQVNNKNGVLQGQLYGGDWGNAPTMSTSCSATALTKVTVQRYEGKVTFYIGETLVATLGGAPAAERVYFYTFAENNADAAVKVTVSEPEITSAWVNVTGATQILQGESKTYTANVYGTSDAAVWSLDTTNLTAGTAAIENGALTVSKDAEGSVRVIATVGGYSSGITVSVADVIWIVNSPSSNFVNVTEDGFTLKMAYSSWDDGGTIAYYKDKVPSQNWVLTFNIAFSQKMTDGKFCVKIGSTDFTICSAGDSFKAEVRGVWGGTFATDWDISNIAVKLVCVNGTVTMYINDTYVCNGTASCEEGDTIAFWEHNENSSETEVTVTASNFKLTEEFLTLSGADKAEQGKTATLNATVYGTSDAAVWSLDTANLTAGTATIENGVLSVSGDAAGYVVVTATVNGYSVSATVTVVEVIKIVTSGNSNLIAVTDDGFTVQMTQSGWEQTDDSIIVYKDKTSSENWELSFNLALSQKMTDGKFCVRIGSTDFTICSSGDSFKAEVRNIWGGTSVTDWDISDIAVKLICENGTVTMYINDTYVCSGTATGVGVNSTIAFWELNETESEYGVTATVTNLTLTNK